MRFKRLLLCLLFISVVSCSMNVEDKNAGLSNEEKKNLVNKSSEESFEVNNIQFETIQAIREDLSPNSNIIEKFYTVRACLNDRRLSKGLANRVIYLDGEVDRLDTQGCIRWDVTIPIDFKVEDRCRILEKELKLGEGNKKLFRYSIDYISDQVTDLDRSPGCQVQMVNNNKMNRRKAKAFELGDVRLTYDSEQDKKDSNLRWKSFQTEVSSCVKVPKTGGILRHTEIKLSFHNQDTGQVSFARAKSETTGEDGVITTNDQGCFTTDFISRYEQYKNSYWMTIIMKMEVRSGPLASITEYRKVYINPWENTRGTFGIGEEGRIPPPAVDFKSRWAKFHLDGVMYIQIGNDTKRMKINKYLGLTIAKTYQVVLNPYVDREHRYSPGQVPIRRLVSEGKFKLSMVLLAPKDGDILINKHNFEDFEYITGAQKIVHVKNGVINEVMTIPFPINELPRLAVRTMSIFKIEPVNDTGLRETIVTGFFKARIPWIKTNVLQEHSLNHPNFVEDAWNKAFNNKKGGQRIPKFDYSAEQVQKLCASENSSTESSCTSGMQEIIHSDYDERTVAYNKYVDDLFARLKTQEDMQRVKNDELKISPKEIYVNHLKKHIPDIKVLKVDKLNKDTGIKLKSRDFDKLLPQNKVYTGMTNNMIKEFCEYGAFDSFRYRSKDPYAQKLVYNKCIKEPYNFFETQPIRHVVEIDKIGDSYTNGFGLNFGERKSVNDSGYSYYTQNSSQFWGIDTGTKIDIPFLSRLPVIGQALPNFGAKAGITWAQNEGETESKGYQLYEGIGTDKQLAVEKFVVDLHAKFERCLLVVSKEFVDPYQKWINETKMKNPLPWLRPEFETSEDRRLFWNPPSDFDLRMYVCDDKVKKESYVEAWYFIQAVIGSNLGRDYDGVLERKILKAFRSEKNFHQLREVMRETTEAALVMDNIAHRTPERILIENWGHLLGDKVPDEEIASYLVDHVEGSFPGTIEGHGSRLAD